MSEPELSAAKRRAAELPEHLAVYVQTHDSEEGLVDAMAYRHNLATPAALLGWAHAETGAYVFEEIWGHMADGTRVMFRRGSGWPDAPPADPGPYEWTKCR